MSIKSKVQINTHYTRSINLERDADSLEVVKAYIPTSRALKLFSRFSEGFNEDLAPRAWSLIGPYGSGKSSASVFLSQLVSSADLATTNAAIKSLSESSPELAKSFQKEISKNNGYLKVLITGSPEPMGKKIIQGVYEASAQFFSLFNGRNPKILGALEELSQAETVTTSEIIDHIVELQKVLISKECRGIYLVIDELGKFLEFEARHYGANDIYMLQALAEHACKGDECNLFLFVLLHQSFEQYAKGLGESLKNDLPVLCQKVAQNERTLFSYLGSHEEFGLQDMIERFESVDDLILPHHVYDYFITNQPAALGDYRTHRRWAEVVTSIERLGDAPEDQLNLLKTIGLLNIIGIKGGFKPSKAILETCGRNKSAVIKALKALSDKSIVTYRKFSGEYRVWQGSDFDLESAVEDEINNIGEFSLANELNKANALMPIVARRHTIKSGALRYFTPEFVDAQTYKSSSSQTNIPRIIFFLASAKDDEKIFHDSVVNHYSSLDIVALCLNGSQLREATAEVIALREIERTRQELNSDPVAKREFGDRLTAAVNSEHMMLQRLQEKPQECIWFHCAEELFVSSKRQFQEQLSAVLEKVYCKSPTLHNELINRDRPSAQANAARNKLLEAMMENPKDLEDLGIDKFPPEKAIYRSILRETGLHNKETKEFQEPHRKSAFYHAWKKINAFLDGSEKEPRSFADLNETLMAPPYGIKAGVLPILYITAYIVYQHELALYESRRYRPIMTGEMLDRFVKRPDEFTFQRFKITGLRSSIFKEYSKIIDTGSQQTVVRLVKPLAQFIGELPEYTKKTKSSEISDKAKRIRNAFNLSKSPEHLIFEDIPKALGYESELEKKNSNLEGLSQALQGCLKELKDAYPNMVKQQVKMLLEAFHMNPDSDLASLRRKAIGRYEGLDQHTVDVDGLRAFIKRITKRQGDDDSWLDNILMFLGQKPTKKWTDTDRAEADVKLSDFAKRILDLEALRVHYDRSKKNMDGEFDVILLKSLKKGSEPIDEVVAIDRKRKDAIQGCKAELLNALHEHSDRELQLAALAEVVDEFLTERKSSNSKANEKQERKKLRGVKNG